MKIHHYRKWKIPRMPGKDVDSRLRSLVAWRDTHVPEGVPLTLEQIGKAVELTRERVRQIEAKALKKLRHPSRIQIIDDNRTKPHTRYT